MQAIYLSCSKISLFYVKIQPVVSRSSLATIPAGVTREEEPGRSHNTKKGAFHEIFNLPESERPLPGETSRRLGSCLMRLRILKKKKSTWNLNRQNKTGLSWTCQTDFYFSNCVQPSDLVVSFFFFSVWEWMEMLSDKQRQEDAHWLHSQRDALRHWEVRNICSAVLGNVTFKSIVLQYCITLFKSNWLCYLVTYGK